MELTNDGAPAADAGTLEFWSADRLRNHRLNAPTFGEIDPDRDADFIESVRVNRILTPLTVAPDGTIISGHRRRQAGARCGLTVFPVIVRRDLADECSIDRAWLESNRQREMTAEQKARWFRERERVESVEAERRMKSGKSDPAANLPQGRAPTAAEIAAAEVGWSRKTAQDAAEVVETADRVEAAGDTETAQELRHTLNHKSVSAAKAKASNVNADRKVTDAQRRDITWLLLSHPTWGDRKIANRVGRRNCRPTPQMVAMIRKELEESGELSTAPASPPPKLKPESWQQPKDSEFMEHWNAIVRLAEDKLLEAYPEIKDVSELSLRKDDKTAYNAFWRYQKGVVGLMGKLLDGFREFETALP